MGILQKLLLLPVLAPLLAVLLLAGLNPGPRLSVRLLIWSSPALPLGLWLALAAGGGAALSAGATDLALRQGRMPLRRQVFRRERGGEEDPEPRRRRSREPDGSAPPRSAPSWPGNPAGPQRPPGEPAPTVAVPFKVLRRGRPARERAGATAAAAPASATAAPPGPDDWNTPPSTDW